MTPNELRSDGLNILALGDFAARWIPGGVDDRILEYGREGLATVSDKFLQMFIDDFFGGDGPFMATPEQAEYASANNIRNPATIALVVQIIMLFAELWKRRQ